MVRSFQLGTKATLVLGIKSARVAAASLSRAGATFVRTVLANVGARSAAPAGAPGSVTRKATLGVITLNPGAAAAVRQAPAAAGAVGRGDSAGCVALQQSRGTSAGDTRVDSAGNTRVVLQLV